MITMTDTNHAPAKSGVRTLSLLKIRAHGRSFEASFLRLKSMFFMAGCMGHLRVAVSLNGCEIPVQSATQFRISPVGGSSQLSEDAAMRKAIYFCTPEDYLSVPPSDAIDIDALSCALARASALCVLLAANFDDEETTHSHEILANACWALEGLIRQAQVISNHDSRGASHE